MDERLKDVHKTDLTESKVNEEFVDWLKTKGPNWLLAILLAICVYFVVLNLQQRKVSKENAAWAELAAALESGLPASLEEVAEKYPKVDQMANFARIQAAERLMLAVQSGLQVGTQIQLGQNPNLEAEGLSDDERTRFLDRAEGLYQQILDTDNGSREMTIHAVSALNGLAAVAESRGEAEAAADLYRRAADRAGDFYPQLRAQAQARADSVDDVLSRPKLMTQVEITAASTAEPTTSRTPIQLDAALQGLLLPEGVDPAAPTAAQTPRQIQLPAR